jgi:serine protease AprX
VFQSIMDAQGGLGGLPLDLGELFEQAYDEGARIHNNSWGATARSAYRTNSLEVDEFVATHPDFLVVIAAGNDGSARVPTHAQAGFVDLFSLKAPGTAKNALTVGASGSDRTIDSGPTWKTWWPASFPDPPIGDEQLSGDAQAMAAFSGRGPCFDQIRMKPDVVAPGTFVLSARAAGAPSDNFWPPPAATRCTRTWAGRAWPPRWSPAWPRSCATTFVRSAAERRPPPPC